MSVSVASVTPWRDGVAPAAWRGGRIFYNTAGRGVVSKIAASTLDGTAVSLDTFPPSTNHGIGDVSSDGKYALVTVERSGHWPYPDGASLAAPGAGTYNDLWLLDLETPAAAWKLVDLKRTGTAALIWPRFSPSGTRVVWTELRETHWFDMGAWTLNVADLHWNAGVPTLVNLRASKSAGFVEAYGFTDSDACVLAAASLPGLSPWNAQIVKYPVAAGIGAPHRLSPKAAYEEWAPFANYCEFAWTLPHRPDRIMYGRTFGALNGSIEYWTMTQDGLDHRRLTFLSNPSSPQFQNRQVLLGGCAFDPDDPTRLVAAYQTNFDASKNEGDYKSVLIQLA